MEREEPRTARFGRCKKGRGGGPAARGARLEVAGSRRRGTGAGETPGQQQRRAAI
jgi:hypothetical protein